MMAGHMSDAKSHGPLSERPEGDAASELSAAVGRDLRRIRTRQGLSLERLAKVSGVSRAMLGQMETGKSTPSSALTKSVLLDSLSAEKEG
jgi:DNA-binding XRE family transcriptional regulator